LIRSKLLIVNADDFGFTPDVNQGIIEAHRNGIVTAATLMAGGAAFDDAVALARATPTLDIGCHLVLVGGMSLAAPGRRLPASVAELVSALALRRISVYGELAAQVERILAAGLAPTHLDTHKHTHMLPSVALALAWISGEYRIPWVRRPLGFPLAGAYLAARLRRGGCRMTDHFAGFRLTGRLEHVSLAGLIRRLPGGTTELMCHPGYLGVGLEAARTRLKASRQRELEALTSPAAKAAIRAAGVQLTNYRSC
jgi:predicted glycoside hydrolase/deacetylase ChbG (UPF0249 family)